MSELAEVAEHYASPEGVADDGIMGNQAAVDWFREAVSDAMLPAWVWAELDAAEVVRAPHLPE